MMKNRLAYYRKQKRLTQEDLAELADTSKVQISRLEGGQRQLTPKWMERLAIHLDCLPEHLISSNNVEPVSHISVPIKGYVQAGQFGEANELSLGDEDVLLYISPKYKNAHGLIVKGDSMNLRYKEGTKLICVPYFGTPEEIEPGRAVIVEAICQADEKEITVKEFYTDENGVHWLLPRSSNPTRQNYPVPNGEDLNITINGRKIKEINIKAIVVSSQFDED
jgi:transcriptional regulator with XRE-family HTH domain